MASLARKLLTLADLHAIPLSGIGTATTGSVLELTDHILNPDVAAQRFLGVWVHLPDAFSIQEYARGLVGAGYYSFPDTSPEQLYAVVETNLGELAKKGTDASITILDITQFGIYQLVFPRLLRDDVLEALHPYNKIVPLLRPAL